MALGFLAAAAAATPRAVAAAGSRYPDASAVLVGIGSGVIHVDLADPNRRPQRFGTKLHVNFDLGYEIRPWLELGADLGLGMLGQSDSLNAVLEREQQSGVGHMTFVHAAIDVRGRWLHGSGRWAPYVRAGGGGVTLSLSAPGGLGSRDNDAAANVGGGLEFYAHRRLVLRAEGLDVVQWAGGGARHHAAAGLTLLYALPRSALDSARR